jgi:hypothetical protein
MSCVATMSCVRPWTKLACVMRLGLSVTTTARHRVTLVGVFHVEFQRALRHNYTAIERWASRIIDASRLLSSCDEQFAVPGEAVCNYCAKRLRVGRIDHQAFDAHWLSVTFIGFLQCQLA